jgi:hypothetical protein
VPLKKNQPEDPKIMQRIVRTVQESIFVHCYLACGHLITVHKTDFKEPFPTSLECWACEEEKDLPSK